MALTAMFVPRVAYPAVPPASIGSSAPASDAASAAEPARASAPAGGTPSAQEQGPEITWSFPLVRVGGSLGYEIRQDSEERRKMVQRGLIATIHAASETFIWQPWFAQLGGNLRLTSSRNSTSNSDTDFGEHNDALKGLIVTGSGQLRILPQSRMPFEAHIEKNDSRTASQLVSFGDYASQRIGFTQQYMYDEGSMLLGYDRNAQTSDASGRDRQDSLQLNLSHSLELHRISVNGTLSRNVRELTGESATQNNLTLQHNYTPISEVTVDTMANVGRSGYRLVQGGNDTNLTQISSMAFWRPEEMPLTVTGGVRLLSLSTDINGNDLFGLTTASLRNANFNLGAIYDVTQHIHLNAATNANIIDTNGTRTTTANQSAGVTYQPETTDLRGFQYNWSASSAVSNHSGGTESGQNLTLQLSHSLSRSYKLDYNSMLTFELSQALSSIFGVESVDGMPLTTKQMTNGGSVSWNLNGGDGSAMVRLSVNDSRALDGNQDYFQMINFQASSNLPTGSFTSWSGNLTIQAVRQGGNRMPVFNQNPAAGTEQSVLLVRRQDDDRFHVTSSGSLTYQNYRAFGVRQLRFISDLRLNGQALLPLFGGPQDQEMAAWDNRLEYYIGRTQFRLSGLVARSKTPMPGGTLAADPRADGPVRVNKSIMFTAMREFGAM
jgi:hypothetical protein